jgi:hypothetical protein
MTKLGLNLGHDLNIIVVFNGVLFTTDKLQSLD